MITGKLRLDLREIDLLPVMQGVVDAVRPTAEAKGVRLKSTIEGDVSMLTVMGDANRLQQVIWNLLSNAIKFTPRGGSVTLGLQRVGQTARLSVRDSGKGVEPQFLPYVFERFRQADSGTTRTHEGLGLGLAIVQDLVQRHGGTVRAESDGLGTGAEFIVELPLVQARAPGDSGDPASSATPPLAAMNKPLVGLRVLLVEDNLEMRESLVWVLKTAGAEVTAVESAFWAFAALRDATFHVLVGDIGLPEEDGYSMIRNIRQSETARGQRITPALALTAYARPEDRAQALAAGFEAYAVKPIHPAQLVRQIATLAGR
jgi:CheY-like chemotaxis protein